MAQKRVPRLPAAILVLGLAAACGDAGNEESGASPVAISDQTDAGSSEPNPSAPPGSFGCGETPVSSDDSVEVHIDLPGDPGSTLPTVEVRALTDDSPDSLTGVIWVQGIGADGTTVTFSDSIGAVEVDPLVLTTGTIAGDLASIERASQLCPGMAEADVAGYLAVVREEGGPRLWVSEPAPVPPEPSGDRPVSATQATEEASTG